MASLTELSRCGLRTLLHLCNAKQCRVGIVNFQRVLIKPCIDRKKYFLCICYYLQCRKRERRRRLRWFVASGLIIGLELANPLGYVRQLYAAWRTIGQFVYPRYRIPVENQNTSTCGRHDILLGYLDKAFNKLSMYVRSRYKLLCIIVINKLFLRVWVYENA